MFVGKGASDPEQGVRERFRVDVGLADLQPRDRGRHSGSRKRHVHGCQAHFVSGAISPINVFVGRIVPGARDANFVTGSKFDFLR